MQPSGCKRAEGVRSSDGENADAGRIWPVGDLFLFKGSSSGFKNIMFENAPPCGPSTILASEKVAASFFIVV